MDKRSVAGNILEKQFEPIVNFSGISMEKVNSELSTCEKEAAANTTQNNECE